MAWSLLGIIIAQITLGILTLVYSIGSIPVLYGALHQGVGILFMAFLFYIRLTISVKRID
jgi:heme A synthase